MQKIKHIWEELNSSFWFVPILMLLFAIGSAVGFIYIDSQTQYNPGGIFHYLLPASVDSARSILTIIAGAMIGVAGTVFLENRDLEDIKERFRMLIENQQTNEKQ